MTENQFLLCKTTTNALSKKKCIYSLKSKCVRIELQNSYVTFIIIIIITLLLSGFSHIKLDGNAIDLFCIVVRNNKFRI